MEYLCVPIEQQRAILETARRFVEDEVIPHAAMLDAERDPAKCYSREIVEKTHALGIRAMTLGEECGGLSADPLYRCENKGRLDRQWNEALHFECQPGVFLPVLRAGKKGQVETLHARVERGEVIGSAVILIN